MGKRGPKSAANANVVALNLVPVSRPAPPDRLRPHGVQAWEQTVDGLPASYFDRASLPLLEQYCAAIALAAEAEDALYGGDAPAELVIRAPSGRMVANPLIAIINSATRSAASLSTKLRISRSSRPKDRGRSPSPSPGRAGLMFRDDSDAD